MGVLAVILVVTGFLLCLALAFYIGQHVGRAVEREECALVAEEQAETLAFNGIAEASRIAHEVSGLIRKRGRVTV